MPSTHDFPTGSMPGFLNGNPPDSDAPAVRQLSDSTADTPPGRPNPLPDFPGSGQSSSGSGRELSFKTEQGAVTCPEYIGEFKVLGLLGRGGMGNVFRVKNPFFDFEQALKMINARFDSREARDLFVREMKTQAELEHTNIVKVYYAGDCKIKGKHHLYFVMSLEATDLGEKIRANGGPFESREAANIVRRLARAMSLAHSRQTFHCDLKPKNILLDANGVPKVTDFGLVKLQSDRTSATPGPGSPFGTPGYMPPEQANGDLSRIDARSDVYGLGTILYELLTGHPPFRGENRTEILFQVKNYAPEPIRKSNPAVPARLEAICLKCLKKDPADRPQSAAELERELDLFLRPNWILRNAMTLATAGVILTLVSAVGLLGYTSIAKPLRLAREQIQKAEAGLALARETTEPETKIKVLQSTRESLAGFLKEADVSAHRDELDSLLNTTNGLLARAMRQNNDRRLASLITKDKDAIPDLKRLIQEDQKLLNDLRINSDKTSESQSLIEDTNVAIVRASAAIATNQNRLREYSDARESLDLAEKQLLNGDQSDPVTEENNIEQRIAALPAKTALALAEIYHLRGETYDNENQSKEALNEYEKGLALRVRHEVLEPESERRTALRDLARSHGYRGDAHLNLGNVTKAREDYLKAREIRKKLADSEAENKIDDKCLHGRDFGNLAELGLRRGDAEGRAEALQSLRDGVLYYEERLGGDNAKTLPQAHRFERITRRLALVELLLDDPDLSADPLHSFGEIDGLLGKVKAEFGDLKLPGVSFDPADPREATGNLAKLTPEILSIQTRTLLAESRNDLARDGVLRQSMRRDQSGVRLMFAHSLLVELDRVGKAAPENYHNWAQILALQIQLSKSQKERRELFVLLADRLQKAIRLGFNKTATLARDRSFDSVRLDHEFKNRFDAAVAEIKKPAVNSDLTHFNGAVK